MTARDPAAAAGATVGDLTEAELLEVVLTGLAPAVRDGHWPAGTVAPGDDAALVPAPRGGTLISTDAMGEGTDFLHRWPAGPRTRGHDAGWKAVAQNLSDVNAMGGTASALVTALTLRRRSPGCGRSPRASWARCVTSARRTAGWPGATWAPADGSTPQ